MADTSILDLSEVIPKPFLACTTDTQVCRLHFKESTIKIIAKVLNLGIWFQKNVEFLVQTLIIAKMISYFGLDALPNQHLNSSTVLLTSECFWCLFLPDLCRNVSNSVNTSLCSSNISWRHSAIFFPPSGEERTAFASSTQTSSSYIMNGFLYSRRIGWGAGGERNGTKFITVSYTK